MRGLTARVLIKGENMKKRVLVSCVLAAALLLTACSGDSGRRSRRDRDDDDDRDSRHERETEETEETEEPTLITVEETRAIETTAETTVETVPTVSDELRSAAYTGYLEIIEDNEDEIRAYNWMSVSPSSRSVMAPSEDVPLALYDVTGDGLEELFMMKADNTMYATLYVYTYDESSQSCYNILTLEYFDVLAGGGGRYALVPLDPGFLFVYTSSGDEDWTITYTIYEYNGAEFCEAGNIEEYSYPNDDYSETIYEYSMNGDSITESDFDSAREEVYDYVEALLQYNYLSDADLVSVVSSVPSYAMSYDDMHDLLSSSI